MSAFASVLLFGVLGVGCRYFINEKVAPAVGFPLHTFVINLVGSFLMGLVFAYASDESSNLSKGVMVGFLGGFTTFSAFSLETLRLLESGSYRLAAAYLLLSPILGVVLAWFGTLLVRRG